MRHQEIARELRRIAPNCADVPRAALDRAHALPAEGRGDDRRRRAAAARVAVPQHAVVAAAPRVQRAVGGEGDRVRPPARDGGDGDAHQAAHPLRDAAGLAVGRQAGTEVAVAVAELAVLVAAPAPHLPLGGEREHVRAAARQRVDRVAQQPLDEPRLEHRAALAGAERAVLALPPREDAAVGVERERRARAAHHRAQVGAAEVRHDLRVDAREVVADAELPVRVRAPAEHVGLELRWVGGARRAELRRVRADRRRQRERLAARRGRRGALGTWNAVFGIAALLEVLSHHRWSNNCAAAQYASTSGRCWRSEKRTAVPERRDAGTAALRRPRQSRRSTSDREVSRELAARSHRCERNRRPAAHSSSARAPQQP